MSINRGMDKAKVAYTYKGTLFRLIKAGNTTIYNSMHGPGRHYIILCETRQSQNDKHCVIPLMSQTYRSRK